MRAVRRAHTAPELIVRRALHAASLRFRLHRRDPPGTPDIVLPRHRTAIFVHGCFWHRHSGCRLTTTPKTRVEFWQDKFDKNVARDAAKQAALVEAGWRVLTIWECETRDQEGLSARLRAHFSHDDGTGHGKN